jgi:glycosyltransferase involved in cell wall biosynthesis
MKILFALHQFFPNHYTGTERLVLNLSKQMQKLGHFAKVFTYNLTETDGFKRDSDFLLKEYEYQGVPVISTRHCSVPEDVSFSIFDIGMEKVIRNVILKEDFDIIHVLHPMRVGTLIKVAKHKNIPVILSPTDFWLMCPKGIAVTKKGELCLSSDNVTRCIRECYGDLWKERLLRRFDESKEIFRLADCIVSATDFLKRVLITNGIGSNIKIIRFGEDYKNVRQHINEYVHNSKITVGFMSTLLPHKGAHVLLEAFNKIKVDNIRLNIYGNYFGETDYYNMLKRTVNDEEKVNFYGEYKYEDMTDIFSGIDILAIPSIWWENSPLILLRALAHNIPIIVSDLGGLTEIIKNEENGFTFEAGNSDSLAKVLQRVGENPTILNEIKANIKYPPRVEEMAFEYENAYLDLLKKKLKSE